MSTPVNVLDLSIPSIRTLHIGWIAFLITFVVWFNHAPLIAHIKEAFDLTMEQTKALLILNKRKGDAAMFLQKIAASPFLVLDSRLRGNHGVRTYRRFPL